MLNYELTDLDYEIIDEMTRKSFLNQLNNSSSVQLNANAKETIRKVVTAEFIARKYKLSHPEKIELWQFMYIVQ